MNTETKNCKNCSTDFVIEPDDFSFYKKIDVPPPTWCPDCRRQRRFSWRNERALYKRTCDKCKESIIAMYDTDAPFPVYCHDCWWSDDWDPAQYGREFDPSKPFFTQYQELMNTVPRLNLFQRNCPGSSYGNYIHETKNVYLAYSTVHSEDSQYTHAIDDSKNLLDSSNVSDSEFCYEQIDTEKNNNTHFAIRSRECFDSWFLFDCVNCRHCILSSNLRNKEYVIRNVEYSKEEYEKKLTEIDFGSYKMLQELKKEFQEMQEKALHRYANVVKSVRSSGDNLHDAKESHHCFDGHDLENVGFLVRGYFLTDSRDLHFTLNSQLVYEYTSGGKDDYNLKFSVAAFSNVRDSDYTELCSSSSNLFGCIALRDKEYSILNKQYSKEEYEKLVPGIIRQMNEAPYIDSRGVEYRYGEFFPIELSPFAYNETLAQEQFPLSEKEASDKGFVWKDTKARDYHPSIQAAKLPDHINDIDNSISEEVIGCEHEGKCNEQCTEAFRIIPAELQFYKKMNLPLPRLCPNCRHYERLRQRNPFKLWHRQCMCDYDVYKNSVKHSHHEMGRCSNEFETSYASERKEIVYCEQCYQAEVI